MIRLTPAALDAAANEREIERLRAENARLEKENLELKGVQQIAVETYDAIWDIVKPDNGSWEYPAQITRYVRALSQSHDVWQHKAALATKEDTP